MFKSKTLLYSVSLLIVVFGFSMSFGQNNNRKNRIQKLNRKNLTQTIGKVQTSFSLNKNSLNTIAGILNKNSGSKSPAGKSGGLGKALSQVRNQLYNLMSPVGKAGRITGIKVHWNRKNGTPVFMTGSGLANRTPVISKAAAVSQIPISFLNGNRKMFKLEEPANEFKLEEEINDDFGKKHLKFLQYYEDIPVWGKSIVFHLDADRKIYALNARYSPTPVKIDMSDKKISSENAVDISVSDLSKTRNIKELNPKIKQIMSYNGPVSKLYIWIDYRTEKPFLAWHVSIIPNIYENWYYFIDAVTGKILEKYNSAPSDGPVNSTAVDLNGVEQDFMTYEYGLYYYMIDSWGETISNISNIPSTGIATLTANYTDLDNVDYVTSNTNQWNDAASVSAHSGAKVIYDYYDITHDRNSYDNNGSTIISIVHVTDDGESMPNAYWNGKLMVYGDGGDIFKPLSGGLDVLAHELTHGVIQNTVNLEYKFQSGALNEAFADWGGAMVDREDWKIGEDIVTGPYYPTGALRDMSDPHNGGNEGDYYWLPAHMNEFQEMDIDDDYGGVHINVGIINKATYLTGSQIGKDKLEQIYYRILSARYLNNQSQFIDMRLACIQAASELYGESSAEVEAVIDAFDAVGITGETGTEPPIDINPVEGEEWISVVNADGSDNSLYLARPVIEDTETDIFQLTSTEIFDSASPVSVTDDGSIIVFVDSDNYIKYIYSDGEYEEYLSSTGDWSSVALSPDGSKMAAASIYIDSTIYIFDLLNPENTYKVKLYSPALDGDPAYTTLFADALDWDVNGEYIVFDAFNSIEKTDGTNIEFWDINLLDVENNLIFRIFPTLPEGISIGGPSFANTSDACIIFDYFDEVNDRDYIMSVDIFSGETGTLVNNGTYWGFPKFSVNDERIVFQYYNDSADEFSVWQMPVDETRLNAYGDIESWINNGKIPVWFAIGERSEVEENESIVTGYFLEQNYPNPFNPETTIKYHVPGLSFVSLKVFDVTGREIKTLVDNMKNRGQYTIKWDGTNNNGIKVSTGTYFYRLSLNGKQFITKKMVLIK